MVVGGSFDGRVHKDLLFLFDVPSLGPSVTKNTKKERGGGSQGGGEQMADYSGNGLVQNMVGKRERLRERQRYRDKDRNAERRERVCVMQFVYQLYILTSKCLHTAASQPQSWAPLGSQVHGSVFNGNAEDVWERGGQQGGKSFVV